MIICLKWAILFSTTQLTVKGHVLPLAKTVSEMTLDHVPTLVSKTFEGIFGPLTHKYTSKSLGRLLGSKTKILK